MIEESVNSRKEGADDEELQSVSQDHVKHERAHHALATPAVLSSRAANHIYDVTNDLLGTEKCSIHPTTPLLHQSHQIGRCVRESLGIGDVGQLEATINLGIDLQAHDPIFSQILISFGASGRLCSRNVPEESIEGTTFNGLPAED